jgi:hypothetical protein
MKSYNDWSLKKSVIYIYIYRERERERERFWFVKNFRQIISKINMCLYIIERSHILLMLGELSFSLKGLFVYSLHLSFSFASIFIKSYEFHELIKIRTISSIR